MVYVCVIWPAVIQLSSSFLSFLPMFAEISLGGFRGLSLFRSREWDERHSWCSFVESLSDLFLPDPNWVIEAWIFNILSCVFTFVIKYFSDNPMHFYNNSNAYTYSFTLKKIHFTKFGDRHHHFPWVVHYIYNAQNIIGYILIDIIQ